MFTRGGGKQGFDEKELRKKEGSISFHFLDFPLLSVHRRSLSGSTTWTNEERGYGPRYDSSTPLPGESLTQEVFFAKQQAKGRSPKQLIRFHKDLSIRLIHQRFRSNERREVLIQRHLRQNFFRKGRVDAIHIKNSCWLMNSLTLLGGFTQRVSLPLSLSRWCMLFYSGDKKAFLHSVLLLISILPHTRSWKASRERSAFSGLVCLDRKCAWSASSNEIEVQYLSVLF